VRSRDLEPVMVRRLKSDLRRLGEAFPERKVERISLASLPKDAPELDLWQRLADYSELRSRRISKLPSHKAALAKLAFVRLQQRLLSPIPAFLRTLNAHRKTLQRLVDGEEDQVSSAAIRAAVFEAYPRLQRKAPRPAPNNSGVNGHYSLSMRSWNGGPLATFSATSRIAQHAVRLLARHRGGRRNAPVRASADNPQEEDCDCFVQVH